MPHSNQGPNYLRGWIYAHFGGFQQLAKILELSTSTVSDWTTQNPRNLLKYSPEIAHHSNTEYDEVVKAVLRREAEMTDPPGPANGEG